MRIAHLDGDPYLSLTLPPREPLCAVCDEPIRWTVELFTFAYLPGILSARLCHGRCVWTSEGFLRESHRAPSHVEKAVLSGVDEILDVEAICQEHGGIVGAIDSDVEGQYELVLVRFGFVASEVVEQGEPPKGAEVIVTSLNGEGTILRLRMAFSEFCKAVSNPMPFADE